MLYPISNRISQIVAFEEILYENSVYIYSFLHSTYIAIHRKRLRDLLTSKFLLVLTISVIRLLLMSEAEILLKLYIILRPSLQSYCSVNLEYR